MLIDITAYVFFFLILALIFCLITLFIVHFFVPKDMLRTYFREPYFSSFEVEFFSGFPFAYIRTAMFMRLAGWPNSGKKRGLTEAYKLAPRWFRVFSRAFIILMLATYFPTIILGAVAAIFL